MPPETEPPRFRTATPILPVPDLGAAIAWYTGVLGFRVTHVDEDPNLPPTGPEGRRLGYACLSRDGATVHLQFQFEQDMAGVVPGMMQLRFELETGSVDALFAEYQAAGAVPEGKACRDTAWGTREFAFYDPNGYGLTFYEDRYRGRRQGPGTGHQDRDDEPLA